MSSDPTKCTVCSSTTSYLLISSSNFGSCVAATGCVATCKGGSACTCADDTASPK